MGMLLRKHGLAEGVTTLDTVTPKAEIPAPAKEIPKVEKKPAKGKKKSK